MNTVQDVSHLSATLGLGASASSQAASGSPAELQDRFLTLLVTQMKNQDPLNPLDNAQVTSQLAQLNTVTGIAKLNTTLEAMAASIGAQQGVQAAALVGHGVLVPGSTIALAGGNGVFAVDLPQDAGSVVVTIKNAAGKVVHTTDVGPQKTGTAILQWDGATDAGTTAPDGNYTYSVAANASGKAVSATALSYGRVSAVMPGADGARLNVQGVGNVPLADVRQII